MILNEKLLSLYAENGINVLLSGRHGVGKTEIIKSVFNSVYGADSWIYFSASTMDPWVDFIGVPKAVKDEHGEDVLELIRPARFKNDNIKAIFFDEFNRAPPKVRNAVMELMQFKSINGKKFNNLKAVWGAINPSDEDGTYDVEELDPAQIDRFQVHIDVPYKLDNKYMKNTHGSLATPFIEWWENLDKDIQFKISPRRLDAGATIYKIGGNLTDVFPRESNVSNLISRIKSISLDDEWLSFKSLSITDKSDFLNNVSNVVKFEKYIINEFPLFIKYVPEDFLINKIELKDNDWLENSIKYIDNLNIGFVTTMEKKYNHKIEDILNFLFFDDNEKPTVELQLNNKNVCITGKFVENYRNFDNKRGGIESLLRDLGANVQDQVTLSTDYLITPNKNTNSVKNQRAADLGVQIISEKEFHKIYKDH